MFKSENIQANVNKHQIYENEKIEHNNSILRYCNCC